MDMGQVMMIFRDALYTAFVMAAPLLLTSLAVGLTISIIQAATQVNEQTLTFVPKLLGIGLMLFIMGPWMMTSITEFIHRLFEAIIAFV